MRQDTRAILLLAKITLLTFCITSCEKDDGAHNDGILTSSAVFNSSLTYGTLADIDGNNYRTIVIGTQTWMAENLRTTSYNDGSQILSLKTAVSWQTDESGAYCEYDNETQEDTIATYGRLYNWYVVQKGNVCPSGWHVPSKDELQTLVDYINSEHKGGALKEVDNYHWYSPNSYATNEYGFTALPGGARFKGGSFGNFKYYGYWWTSTAYSQSGAYAMGLYYSDGDVGFNGSNMHTGYSIRCIKDN
ncbi:MAG: fibrobacter succinogenes major paralogous domain-containing protein [Rikenellaceae bacterium]|nr:fibrobacter succinogenes major paralogous domain-containing protein [Rikenellaceae bacterium]